MDVQNSTHIRTTKEICLKVTGDELVRFVNQELKAQGHSLRIGERATVCVAIPGGGDWSNTELDIDAHTPVQIRWREVAEEGSEL